MALAVAGSAVALLAPTGIEGSAVALPAAIRSPGAVVPSPQVAEVVPQIVRHVSLLQVQGWSVAIPLLIPVAIAAAGAIALMWNARDRRGPRGILLTSTTMLAALVVVELASVGALYLPSSVVMVLASLQSRRSAFPKNLLAAP